ncbi:serine/threonine-protein kinase [Nocardioides alkalitolerans]|uniref:serine/threonine-protein kinase n=1 Tax=Nocardioides alkalitolerans TaxID=281714 RepID=UPI0004295B28|nr:serine/threonine-protein kinase [Nocardioides alkalitolerans]
MSGPEIPGFTYLQHLGSGGFAHVFLYEQQWPRQRVAIKVVRPDVPLTDREKQLFTSEADAMARLADHPYIVSVITAGITSPQQGSRPYLVMRYCPPPDLGLRVRTQPMTVPDAVATGVKLASAVETAHRAGILHRDIKPSNVLVTTYSEPALSDFGIAGRAADVHRESEIRISYPWTAPELLEGRSNGSVASDVYSLGATIWNLLVGRSPFAVPQGDNSTPALSARILHSPPPPTGRADVPPALDRLLQQAMAKHPSHRPGSALELARSLQQVESAAGYARTAIAVETVSGDAPAGGAGAAAGTSLDPDVTSVKPLTVVSASGPRSLSVDRGTTGGGRRSVEPDEDDDAPLSRSGLVWTVVGVVVLLAVAAALFLRPGGGDDEAEPDDGPSAAASTTPGDIAPDAPAAPPTVTVTPVTGGVEFAWTTDDLRASDTWEYRVPATGQGERTSDTSLVVPLAADGRTCMQVRQIRATTTSPWAERCAD